MNRELLQIKSAEIPSQKKESHKGRVGKAARTAFSCLLCLVALAIFSVASTEQTLAVTSVSMSVNENPYNKVAAQLQQKEKALSERELLVKKYETELQRGNMATTLAILVLALLVMLNFYLDYHRKRLDQEKRPDNVRYLKL